MKKMNISQAYHVYSESAKSFMSANDGVQLVCSRQRMISFGSGSDGTVRLGSFCWMESRKFLAQAFVLPLIVSDDGRSVNSEYTLAGQEEPAK
jgi:hypothetical protein